MNSTVEFSCYDGSGLSHNSVTTEFWNNEGTHFRDTALVSATVTLCFVLVGVPSNLLIIVSILWQHLYRQPTYILLLNLAIVDLLMCVLVMPFTIISGFAGGFIFGNTDIIRCRVCQLGIIFTLFALLTIHILALLSIDRFIFIKCALKYHKIVTVKCCTLVCCCLWSVSFVLSSLPLFGFGDLTFGIHVSVCSIHFFGKTQVTNNINYAIFLAVELLIPLTAILVTNVWILCIIQRQMRKIYSWKNESHENRDNFRSKIQKKLKTSKYMQQLRLVKVFGAIWIANIITWTPFLIRVIASILVGDETFNKWFLLYIFLSIISFAVLHPIIEASFIPELRKIVVSLLQKKLCCKEQACAWPRANQCHSKSFSDTKFTMCCKDRHFLECLDIWNASVLPMTEVTDIAD